MTGQHRAPVERSRPGRAAAAVAAGVATATGPLAISAVMAPTVAEAAPASANWDRVAQCESTQRWDANTGNGFSGGLQFTDSTWRAFGGRTAHAYQASRSEQIAIAENVLAGQGIGAWPVCGRRGLGGTTANVPAIRSNVSVRATPRPAPHPPAVPDQPRAVQQAVAASGPTNPACQALKRRGVPVGQLDALNRAHPELALDGNGNGTPCEITYPRTAAAPTAARVATTASAGPQRVSSSASAGATGTRAAVVATARAWLGDPYRWGGNTHAGVDCSGLVQQVLAARGVRLPRTADAQLHASARIARSAAQPGDLVFATSGGHAYHVGIFLGGNQMIDAPHTGATVGVHTIWASNPVFGRVL